jgi:signal transduction histidine kinase
MEIACHDVVRAAATDVAARARPLDAFDQSAHALAELLRGHQRAQVCVIVTNDGFTEHPRMYRADRRARAAPARRVTRSMARWLLAPAGQVVIYGGPGSHGTGTAVAFDAASHAPMAANVAQFSEIANLLETDSFISLPLYAAQKCVGRVHFGSRSQRYTEADLAPMARLVQHAGVTIENMRLVGRLAVEMAAEERRRISRDLHDGTIQPYVGLKLALEALRRRAHGSGELAHEVDELINMAGDGINELRQYVGCLRTAADKTKHADWLLPAIRCQAQKFNEFYGIETLVLADNDVPVTAAMRDEVIHMVREGLSNIRRHTCSRQAIVGMRSTASSMHLELINVHAGHDAGEPDFHPRSIGERAAALGGRASVQRREEDNAIYTVVAIELPL